MAPARDAAPNYLEKHGPTYRVSYPIPKDLQKRFGKMRLKASLGTGDLRKAHRLKTQFIARFDEQIELVRAAIRLERGSAEDKAKLLKSILAQPDLDPAGITSARMDIELEYQGLLGKPISHEFIVHDDGEEDQYPIYDPSREANANLFLSKVQPTLEEKLDAFVETWIDTKLEKRTKRTKEDTRRAVRYLKDWCKSKNVPLDVAKMTSVTASDFLDDFEGVSGGLQGVTRAKYLNRLSMLWVRLRQKGWVTTNIWDDYRIEIPARNERCLERAFRMDEVRRLLRGNPPEKLRDVMMIGLVTGARLDAIVSMKVGDVLPGRLRFEPRKKEIKERFVPIHPLLHPILKRRTFGKSPHDDLFPDWPAPKKKDSIRERSFKTSNAFTDYRRKCGVDEVVDGDRRSKVNFHSFRRWFITHMRRIAPLDMVQSMVGHSHGNEADDTYVSTGPLFDEARRYIWALPIPPDNDDYVPEPDGVNLYDTELTQEKSKRRRKYA